MARRGAARRSERLQVGEVRLGMAAPNNLAWLAPRYPLSTILQILTQISEESADRSVNAAEREAGPPEVAHVGSTFTWRSGVPVAMSSKCPPTGNCAC